MDINRRDCHAWFNRGKILANLGEYEEALSCYDRALAIKISYYEAWCEKGIVLEELGYWQEAEICFNESLGVFGDDNLEENLTDDQVVSIPGEDNGSISYNKACFHALQGNLEQALYNLRDAIALNPNRYLAMADRDRDLHPLRQDCRFRELVVSKLIIQTT